MASTPRSWALPGQRRTSHLAALTLALVMAGAVASCTGPAARPDGPARAWPGTVTAGPAMSGAGSGGASAPARDAVYTQRGSNSRVGWNYHETTLNTRNVSPKTFGRLAAFPVLGKIYGQPLFVPALVIGGQKRDVVLVTTEDDQAYAFDANGTGASALLWHTNFLVHGAVAADTVKALKCGDYIKPTIGITGTPVIDPATKTMYLVTVMREGHQIVDAMHALDITSGRDRVRPVVIRASVRGTGMGSRHGMVPFYPLTANQHAALLLDHGVVYAAFASYCDNVPSHGWVLGYDASSLRQAVAYNDTPNGFKAGIWQSATGPVADSAGDIFLTTGDGSFDLNTGGKDAGNSMLELRRDGSTLKVTDWFTPFTQACMNQHDEDLSSGAPLMVGNEIITIAKTGAFYVLDKSHLGGYHTVPNPCPSEQFTLTNVDRVIQETKQQVVNGGVWSAETAWAGGDGTFVYTGGEMDHVKAWRLARGKIVLPAASQGAETMAYPGTVPIGSSDGASANSAILWVFDQENHAPPALRAYAAADLSHELWNSQQDVARDAVPKDGYDNFMVPTIAAGRVYLGTSGELLVYGLLHHS